MGKKADIIRSMGEQITSTNEKLAAFQARIDELNEEAEAREEEHKRAKQKLEFDVEALKHEVEVLTAMNTRLNMRVQVENLSLSARINADKRP